MTATVKNTAVPGTKPHKVYVCPNCGSTHCTLEALELWNEHKQCWMHVGSPENIMTCQDCGLQEDASDFERRS